MNNEQGIMNNGGYKSLAIYDIKKKESSPRMSFPRRRESYNLMNNEQGIMNNGGYKSLAICDIKKKRKQPKNVIPAQAGIPCYMK